jgi:hypothetical protein
MPKHIANIIGYTTNIDKAQGNKGIWNTIDHFYYYRDNNWGSSSLSPAADAYSANLQLAMPFANINGPNTFLNDYSAIIKGSGTARTIGGSGPTLVTSPSPKWSSYGGSMRHANSGGGFAYASNDGNNGLQWYLNTQYTAEGWVYASSGSYGYSLINSADDVALYYWGFDVSSTDAVSVGAYTSPPSVTSSTGVVPRDQWYHWAFARNGNALAYWINGTRVSYNASATWSVAGNMGYVNFSNQISSTNTVLKQDLRIYDTLKYNPASSTITVPGAMYQ